MDSKPAQAFLEFLKTDASWFLSTWYAVITKGTAAFAAVDLTRADTLVHALRFLLYIAVFGLLLEVPAAALLKIPYDNPAFVASSLALSGILWLGYATVLHGAMKAFGGRAELQQSLAIFCFSTAWFVPIMVLQWPLFRYAIPVAKGDPVSPELIMTLPSMEMIALAVAALLSTALLAYFFWITSKALQHTHRLAGLRALSALVIGVGGVLLVVLFFSMPMYNLLYNAFK